MTKPADIICEYYKELNKSKEDFELKMKTAKTNMQRENIKRGYKLCCLDMAEMTHGYYSDMENYELHDMLKSVEIIKTNLDTYATKNSELQSMIQSSAKKLSELKGKVHEAHDAACAMRNCINRHLNLDGGPDGGADNEASQEVKDALRKVMQKSTDLDAEAQDAAEAMVKVAGIQTFTDVEGVKELVDELSTSMNALHESVTGYISSASEQVTESQESLITVVEELNTEEFSRYENKTSRIGVQRSMHFICKGHCAPIEYVDQICESMGNNEPGPQMPAGKGMTKGDER